MTLRRSLPQILADTVDALEHAGVDPEQLAVLEPPRRTLWVFRTPPRFRAVAPVWRLGEFLLTVDGRWFVRGKTVRAAKRERLGVTSAAQETRRDLAGYAFVSGFAAGAEVNYDATELPVTLEALAYTTTTLPELPVRVVDDEIRVLWRPGADLAAAPSLENYLAERVDLKTNPLGERF